MKEISAQVSIYPLRQPDLRPVIYAAWDIFESHDLRVQRGAMSTVIWGEMDEVFDALKEAFEKADSSGDAVMVVTFSNACPKPGAASSADNARS
jgi:uncharacterized protein YqgV (UPF0045/DUF77 family)